MEPVGRLKNAAKEAARGVLLCGGCGFARPGFKESGRQMGNSGESTWPIRSGYRLWTGPEALHYTYGLG